MQRRVWIFQYRKDLRSGGPSKASWYVGWYETNGRRRCESCGPGSHGRRTAERRQRQLHSEFDTNTYRSVERTTWEEFVEQYRTRVLELRKPKTQIEALISLRHFSRLMRPGPIAVIDTQTVDSFIAKRSQERGRKPGSLLTAATINKDLRHLKAAFHVAEEWSMLPKLPRVRMVREPVKLPRYVTDEHFALIYAAGCPQARLPEGTSDWSCRWWRAILTAALLTGQRIGALLQLRWEDVDLVAGRFRSRYSDTKGDRDLLVNLHPIVVEHLRSIHAERGKVFPWSHDRTTLLAAYCELQRAAGIHLNCREPHPQHTHACHVYSFHDLRRAFATNNALNLKPEVLQALMGHTSYKTTLGYINLAKQVNQAAPDLHVPGVLRPAT